MKFALGLLWPIISGEDSGQLLFMFCTFGSQYFILICSSCPRCSLLYFKFDFLVQVYRRYSTQPKLIRKPEKAMSNDHEFRAGGTRFDWPIELYGVSEKVPEPYALSGDTCRRIICVN
jgi:hypothetical protein